MTKKLLIDLWASATSHYIVFAGLGSVSGWVQLALVIALTAIVFILLARSGNRRKDPESTSRHDFLFKRESNGNVRLEWTVPVESKKQERDKTVSSPEADGVRPNE